jgi:hypothetical protein
MELNNSLSTYSPSGYAWRQEGEGVRRIGNNPVELSEAERKRLDELKRRDAEVRAHERAHVVAGGSLVRGVAAFDQVRGPDGRYYAVGGEVSIDTSKERDPEATIEKAARIRQAALAPADPSAQDRKVAAEATRMEAEARAELIQKRQREEGAIGNGAYGRYSGREESILVDLYA